MTPLKYLRLLITATDNEWPAVTVNLQKARNIWYRLFSIFGKEGADPRMSGSFYLAVVQAVLLFDVKM